MKEMHENLPLKPIDEKVEVTFHSSSHNSLDYKNSGELLLKQVYGEYYIESSCSSEYCGSSFLNLKEYNKSEKLTDTYADNILKTGVKVIVTDSFDCLFRLEDQFKDSDKVKVKHITEMFEFL